ncbi:MAG TPA: BLUF domain-containing protein [Oscillatoriaceae cyanobacterium M33_DOE_052]|uniref:Family 3 adenylate cyclase n=1 Tax=Planktothricoides sp. SpSt-374 TaxID=2282167 RepID=A0A7C3VT33_9CYAN|nr:BLUF domain-containing protein [Oscillatoriaceae cyanobacterium M33_DOE_052]
MKRLTYISKFSRHLSPQDIENIGSVSSAKNRLNNITGVLLCLGEIFFQILEGEETKIDVVYEKILRDDRHTEILCLKLESDITERLFPEWSMRTINLDENTDMLVKPIKTLLHNVTESHRILEKYTQPTIFKLIKNGVNPLEVRPRKVEKIIMFCDIMSFSTIADKLPVEQVVFLVNHYLTICTNIISERGGEVTKFIGDSVMAYFDSDQADDAIQASLDILTEIQNLRNTALDGSILRVLHTGIGLAKGPVIEGNIGSAVKKDYTILGDAVNLASRLEGATRNLPYALIFSAAVKNSAHHKWDFVYLGDRQTKGKSEPVQIYSIDCDITRYSADNEPINDYLAKIIETLNFSSLV